MGCSAFQKPLDLFQLLFGGFASDIVNGFHFFGIVRHVTDIKRMRRSYDKC